MGTTLAQPLAGGASIGTTGNQGTLGGILISPKPGDKQYQLHAVTNFHVAAAKAHVCQPSNNFNGGTCKDLGDVEVACCAVADQSSSGKGMDVSVTPINPNDRWNTICSQYTAVQQGSTPKANVLDVTGPASAKSGDVVTKYGRRTSKTQGKLMSSKTSFGTDWEIFPPVGTTPDFADAQPQPTPGATPTVAFTGQASDIPAQISPQSEPTFFDTEIRVPTMALIMAVKDPATTTLGLGGRTFNQDQAKQIFDSLWANKRISMFCAKGDSGSWVTKDDGTVVALMSQGLLEEREPMDLEILGHKWGFFTTTCVAYSINKVVNYVNNLLQADPNLGFATEVCVESLRPKPPASAANANVPDCSSAVVTGGSCSWPYACKPNAAGATPACVPQSPTP